MAVSKLRKNHKQKLNQFKQQKMSEQNKQFEIPEVRSVPVWANDAKIVMSGLEFEAIFNGLMQIQTAQQAVNGIMSRNILDGNIAMDFEKFDKQKQDYGPMSEEEKAPYRADFEKALEAAKKPPVPQSEGIIQTEPLIVDPISGVELKSENLPKEEAKIVTGDFGAKPKKAKKVKVTEDTPVQNV